jgi:hypothetical protein
VANKKKQARSLRAGNGKNTNVCGKLDQCYLLNIETGKKVSLSVGGAVVVDNPNDRHTIICDTMGKIDQVVFDFDGQQHLEFIKPWSMAGDTKDKTHSVPYLTTLGEKDIKVTGQRGNTMCFEQVYSYGVYSDMSQVPAHHGRDLLEIEIGICIGDVCVYIVIR